MTQHHVIEGVIEQYLLYLDGQAEQPNLDALSSEDRKLAETLIRSLLAARGMDPESRPPTIEHLLAASGRSTQSRTTASSAGIDLLEIRERMEEVRRHPLRITADISAQREGISSDFVVYIAGHRIRIQVRDDLDDAAGLRSADSVAAAAPVFGRFPETAGVIALITDANFSSVAIDPFDCEYCIEAPTGHLIGPRTLRPVLPLADSMRAFLDEISPVFDPIPTTLTAVHTASLDSSRIGRNAVRAMVEEGKHARISAKRDALTSLGDREAEGIASLIVAASKGQLNESILDRRLEELVEVR